MTPVRYLLRVDDLCPTVARAPWLRLSVLIEAFRLRPILAVVPDNHDPHLCDSPAQPEFWRNMRDLQRQGSTIGLHGYRHLCFAQGRSLVDFHRVSEFAGVDLETQRDWIHAGLEILRDHDLNPRIWVAPRHGFDRNTLVALHDAGINRLSDGLAHRPHLRYEMTWIPQQLWQPVEKVEGVWTICVHPGTASAGELDRLHSFLVVNANLFTSVDELLAEGPATPLTLRERVQMELAMRRFQLSRAKRALFTRTRSGSEKIKRAR